MGGIGLRSEGEHTLRDVVEIGLEERGWSLISGSNTVRAMRDSDGGCSSV